MRTQATHLPGHTHRQSQDPGRYTALNNANDSVIFDDLDRLLKTHEASLQRAHGGGHGRQPHLLQGLFIRALSCVGVLPPGSPLKCIGHTATTLHHSKS